MEISDRLATYKLLLVSGSAPSPFVLPSAGLLESPRCELFGDIVLILIVDGVGEGQFRLSDCKMLLEVLQLWDISLSCANDTTASSPVAVNQGKDAECAAGCRSVVENV